MLQHISSSAHYPEDLKKQGIAGNVYVGFEVNDKGEVVNVRVIRGVHDELDQIALEAVASMPNWKPAIQNGKAIKSEYTLPVVFQISNKDLQTICLTKSECEKIHDNIENYADAFALTQSYSSDICSIVKVSEESSSFPLLKNLKALQTTTIEIGHSLYSFQFLDSISVKLFRASYIYFDANKMTLNEIDQKRNEIIRLVKQGKGFEELARQHSMDPSGKRGGDLGWFKKGSMVGEFEIALENHEVGEVFPVDVPDRKWFYVVKKTGEEPKARALRCLAIKTCSEE